MMAYCFESEIIVSGDFCGLRFVVGGWKGDIYARSIDLMSDILNVVVSKTTNSRQLRAE